MYICHFFRFFFANIECIFQRFFQRNTYPLTATINVRCQRILISKATQTSTRRLVECTIEVLSSIDCPDNMSFGVKLNLTVVANPGWTLEIGKSTSIIPMQNPPLKQYSCFKLTGPAVPKIYVQISACRVQVSTCKK